MGEYTSGEDYDDEVSTLWPVSYCCCHSIAQLCPTACEPMDLSMPGLPCPHHLLEFAQIHIHRVSDAIQPSHPLLLSSPFAFKRNASFPSIRVFSSDSAIGIRCPKIGASASVLPMSIQGWFPLGWTGWISLQSKRLSRVFSNTTVQKHQFSGAQPSLQFYFLHWTKARECLLVSSPLSVLWEKAQEITDFCVSPARSDGRGWNPDLLLNSLLLTGHHVTLNSLPSISFPHEIEMRPWWLQSQGLEEEFSEIMYFKVLCKPSLEGRICEETLGMWLMHIGHWLYYGVEEDSWESLLLWNWRRLLRVPWTARRSNQSILKEISP